MKIAYFTLLASCLADVKIRVNARNTQYGLSEIVATFTDNKETIGSCHSKRVICNGVLEGYCDESRIFCCAKDRCIDYIGRTGTTDHFQYRHYGGAQNFDINFTHCRGCRFDEVVYDKEAFLSSKSWDEDVYVNWINTA